MLCYNHDSYNYYDSRWYVLLFFCFSMQVVINKCFVLNHEKNLAQIHDVVFEKNASLIPKNDVTDPKARLL